MSRRLTTNAEAWRKMFMEKFAGRTCKCEFGATCEMCKHVINWRNFNMWDFCNTTVRTARKKYDCGASYWILRYGYIEIDFFKEDWKSIQVARAEKFKILPGTKYMESRGKFEGRMVVYRERMDMRDICIKYDF